MFIQISLKEILPKSMDFGGVPSPSGLLELKNFEDRLSK